MKEENLIFIASQPRSGSTLLQNLLSNNKETNTTSEPWLMLSFINYFRPDLFSAKFNYNLSKDATNEYLKKYPQINIKNTFKNFIKILYKPLFGSGFKYIIDKTPRYYLILKELHDFFPKSTVVVLKRNPIDVVRSIIKTWNISTFEDLLPYYQDIILAPFIIHEFCEKNKENPNVIILKFEELISNTGNEIRAIYDQIGIEYKDAVLDISHNTKFKGKYGDPNQNHNPEFVTIKKNQSKNQIEKKFEKFILGYSNYLGDNFLDAYGGYVSVPNSRKTLEFNYFKRLASVNIDSKYGIRNLILLQLSKIFL